jgi:hypothetical protein
MFPSQLLKHVHIRGMARLRFAQGLQPELTKEDSLELLGRADIEGLSGRFKYGLG